MHYTIKEDDLQLDIDTKKLKSGRHQLKFQVRPEAGKGFYGYLLVEPQTKWNDVLAQLKDAIDHRMNKGWHSHAKLFNLGKENRPVRNVQYFQF